jgi:pheromone shutdown protein TraB
MRGLMGNLGFTVSVLSAVAMTAAFVFFLEAPLSLAAAILVLGLFTALIEHHLHSRPRR